ncbi:MAG: phosphoribosyltransferase family protein [Candidatus Curtissbacteria bacterium]|nr:phosphoribosyltransferase family protein [Candidatus Curtissbacteria bacterium]MDZ4209656.1 phosphoribosyltransferase family protein [Candidatus Curtissbacteria bacterium]
MDNSGAKNIMVRVKAIRQGHFVLTSGLHADTYVNKDAIYPHTRDIKMLCWELATNFCYVPPLATRVIAPEKGGIILSQWVADAMSEIMGREVLALYAEKTDNGGFTVKRGYDQYIPGQNILVVEDVLTTGGSARKVIEVTRSFGGKVVGLGVLCNRGNVTPEQVGNVEITALTNLTLPTYEADACPLCAKGIPINTDVGKGKEFLESQKRRD